MRGKGVSAKRQASVVSKTTRSVLLFAALASTGLASATACSSVYGEENSSSSSSSSSSSGGLDGSPSEASSSSSTSSGGLDASSADVTLDAPASCRTPIVDGFEMDLSAWLVSATGTGTAVIVKQNVHSGMSSARFSVSGNDIAFLQNPLGGSCPLAIELWVFVPSPSSSIVPIFQLGIGGPLNKQLLVISVKGEQVLIAPPNVNAFAKAFAKGTYHRIAVGYDPTARKGEVTIDQDSISFVTEGLNTDPAGVAMGLVQIGNEPFSVHIDDVSVR